MEHLADLHRSLVAYAGRLSAESFKSQVVFVIEMWENWYVGICGSTGSADLPRGVHRIVFTPEITEKMRAILNGASSDPTEAENQAKAEAKKNGGTPDVAPVFPSKFKSGGFKKAFVPIDTVAAPVLATMPAVIPPVDDDLDGEAMELDEDIDGEVMGNAENEDLDGEAMVD
jgi:U2-associated protein SR140